MLHLDQTKLKAFQKLMREQRTKLSGLLAVKGGRALINIALMVYRLVQAKAPTKSNVRVCKSFAFEIYRLAKFSGVNFVVLYLKTCSILLQQYVAKHTARAGSRVIGGVAVSVTRSGLPRIIPRVQRVLIRRGNRKAITLWLSLFNLYRYLECAYKAKDHFATITEQNDWYPSQSVVDFIPIFWKSLKRLVKIPPSDLRVTVPQIMQSVSVSVTERMGLKGSSLFAALENIHGFRYLANLIGQARRDYPSFKETGLSKSEFRHYSNFLNGLTVLAESWWPAILDVLAGPLSRGPSLWNPRGATVVKGDKELNLIDFVKYHQAPLRASASGTERFAKFVKWLSTRLFGKPETYVPAFGRLVKLYEAAGKVRIIAIVDPITNWLLKPLHDWVFAILREIPQDGTFDQEKPLLPIVKSHGSFIGSCDMSAATDRLPVRLQALLLGHIFGPKIAKAWMHLLVSRPYVSGFKPIWYAVGQPMGALSSWAMLALTHHFMWQWAAYRAGVNLPGRWFKSYAVLGDDSVAIGQPVVQEYLEICRELGVKVNLAKSLLSPVGALEFAKRFFSRGQNCSPVSIGEILVSHKNFATMSGWPRKRKIRISDLFSVMGYRHKVCGSLQARLYSLPPKVRNMIIVLRSPWGAIPSKSLFDWLRIDGYDRSRDHDMSWVGINILVMYDRFRLKALQVMAENVMPFQFRGTGGDTPREILLSGWRQRDPMTYEVLMSLTLEPSRKKLFSEVLDVLDEVRKLQLELHSRVFFMSEEELTYYWDKYVSLEKRFNSVYSGRVYLQAVEKPFVEPSPRQVVQLWNTLRNPTSYSRDWDLSTWLWNKRKVVPLAKQGWLVNIDPYFFI